MSRKTFFFIYIDNASILIYTSFKVLFLKPKIIKKWYVLKLI